MYQNNLKKKDLVSFEKETQVDKVYFVENETALYTKEAKTKDLKGLWKSITSIF